jgi:hypothetical protein
MDRRTIALIWLGGIVLMLAIYVIGPQNFIATCEQFVADGVAWLGNLIDTLMLRAFEVVRAAAIAMYVVFVVLAVLAMGRGLRAGGMLFVVSAVFLLLVRTDWYAPGTKWLAACVLAAVAAGTLTKRLLHAPRPRNPADPWGVGSRGSGVRPDPHEAPSKPQQ